MINMKNSTGILPHASEYREKLDALKQRNIETQLKSIFTKFEEITRAGKDKISINNLIPEVKSELVSLGYKVQEELSCGVDITSCITIP